MRDIIRIIVPHHQANFSSTSRRVPGRKMLSLLLQAVPCLISFAGAGHQID
jgi:hypothetical protein